MTNTNVNMVKRGNCYEYTNSLKLLSSASYGPVLQSDGENHKGEEDHFENSLHVTGCAGSSAGNSNTHSHFMHAISNKKESTRKSSGGSKSTSVMTKYTKISTISHCSIYYFWSFVFMKSFTLFFGFRFDVGLYVDK